MRNEHTGHDGPDFGTSGNRDRYLETQRNLAAAPEWWNNRSRARRTARILGWFVACETSAAAGIASVAAFYWWHPSAWWLIGAGLLFLGAALAWCLTWSE